MSYSASFTAGGILFSEFEAILPFIQKEGIRDFLVRESKENNYLRIATESARKRVITELKKRIDAVNPDFWSFYHSRVEEDRRLLLFYLCVKTYQLVWDFHYKVTLPGYWAYHHHIDELAYKMYLDELGSKVDDVNRWSESTSKKCITNYIRMLNESGILQNGKLHKPAVENDFYCYYIKDGKNWALDIFLLNNREKELIGKYCQ